MAIRYKNIQDKEANSNALNKEHGWLISETEMKAVTTAYSSRERVRGASLRDRME